MSDENRTTYPTEGASLTYEEFARRAAAEMARLTGEDEGQIFSEIDCRAQFYDQEPCAPEDYAAGYLDALADLAPTEDVDTDAKP